MSKYIPIPKSLQEFKELFEQLFPSHDFEWKEYPNRIMGLCPFHEDTNPSFNIYESDGKLYYKCFACGEKGTPFTVLEKLGLTYRKSENVKTLESYEQVKKKKRLTEEFVTLCREALKENLSHPSAVRLKEKIKPVQSPDSDKVFTAVLDYFGVGLVTEKVFKTYASLGQEYADFLRSELSKVGIEGKAGWIVFPYYSHSGSIVSFKVRNIFESSRSSRVYAAVREKAVFGWKGVLDAYLKRKPDEYAVRTVGVVEGETDAMSLVYAGLPAFAVGSASNYDAILTHFPLSTYKFVPVIFPDFDPMTLDSRGRGVDAVVDLLKKRNALYRKKRHFEKIYVLCDRFAYAGRKDVNEALKECRIEDILSCQIEEIKTAVAVFEKEWVNYKRKRFEEEVEPKLKGRYDGLIKPAKEAIGIKDEEAISLATCSLWDLYNRDPNDYPPPILGRFPVRCVSVIASFGGVGKTTWALITAIRIAKYEGLRVLFWTTEHEESSIVKTLHRIMRLGEFWDVREEEKEEMKRALSMVDVRTASPEVFYESPKSPPNPKVKELFEQILTEYDVVICDPFLSFIGVVDEGANPKFRKFFDTLHEILREFEGERKAVIFLHHFGKEALRTVNLTNKKDDKDKDVIDEFEDGTIKVKEEVANKLTAAVRGASAVVDSARYVECIAKTDDARYCLTIKTNEHTRPKGYGERIPDLPPILDDLASMNLPQTKKEDIQEEDTPEEIEF